MPTSLSLRLIQHMRTIHQQWCGYSDGVDIGEQWKPIHIMFCIQLIEHTLCSTYTGRPPRFGCSQTFLGGATNASFATDQFVLVCLQNYRKLFNCMHNLFQLFTMGHRTLRLKTMAGNNNIFATVPTQPLINMHITTCLSPLCSHMHPAMNCEHDATHPPTIRAGSLHMNMYLYLITRFGCCSECWGGGRKSSRPGLQQI